MVQGKRYIELNGMLCAVRWKNVSSTWLWHPLGYNLRTYWL